MERRPAARVRGIEFPAAAQVPSYLTTLVGRREETAELRRLLGRHRLVTLVGAGGVGKTRLAATVAEAPGGRAAAAWVDVTPVTDPTLVALHAVSALGVRERPGETPCESLIGHLGPHAVLLVLDNCEHLAGACAELADTLLRGCPSLRILATSRQPLSVPGEKAWPVPPLATPDADDGGSARESAAVQLFEQRAGDVQPAFRVTTANMAAVAGICRRLDGLPLAIELAAARVSLLPPEQLLTRLDGIFDVRATRYPSAQPRHRTLRALIDWSYDLLSPPERLLFERLAMFAGGFTLDAAEAVTPGDGLDAADVLDLLAGLVDKSLVGMREWRGEARYFLLETVRLYARDRLAAGARPDAVERLRHRHADHFLAFSDAAAAGLRGPTQLEWLARLDAEHDNLRLALGSSLEAGAPERALRLCVALLDFWRVRGHLTEGQRWIADALQAADSSPALRARALVGAAVFDRQQGDYVALQQRLAESEALARQAGDRTALAEALTQLGISLRERHDLAGARERLDEALSLWRDVGDVRGLASALGVRSSIALAEGDTAHARMLRHEAVEASHRAGDREGLARSLIGLGEIARLEGDHEEAWSSNQRARQLFEELGDPWHVSAALHNMGWIAVEAGRPAEAYRAFSDSIGAFDSAGNPFGRVLCLAGIARVLVESGDAYGAAVVFAAATNHAMTTIRIGVQPAAPADAACWERTRAAIEADVAGDRLLQAGRTGAAMGLAEAFAWARERLDALPDPGHAQHEDAAPYAGRAADAAGSASETHAFRATSPKAAMPAAASTPAGAALRVHALGPLRIFLGDRPLAGDAFGSSKPRELLLILLCRRDGATREQIGTAFWPDASAAQVKNSFHVTLHRLRRTLEHPDWIVLAGDRYRIDPDLSVDFDVTRFEAAITADLGDLDAADAAHRIGAALALYGGDFLDGEVVGDWHLEIRDRLRRLFEAGLMARAELLMDAGRFREAAADLRTLLVRDPLHEEACRRLMTCHVRLDEPIEALRLYATFQTLLRDELGVEPAASTTALVQSISAAAPPQPTSRGRE